MQAKLQKSRQELCCLEIFLDHLKDADFPLLLDIFAAIISSEIDAVDIRHESHLHESHSDLFNGESVVSLIRAVGQKLRIVDLQDLPFGKDFLLYVSVVSLTSIFLLCWQPSFGSKCSCGHKEASHAFTRGNSIIAGPCFDNPEDQTNDPLVPA